MRFVKNSGVCETTPGVQQISGYLNIGTNMSMVSISFPLNIFGQSLTWIWNSVVLVLWVSNFSGIGSFHSLVCPIVCLVGTQIYDILRLNGGPGCSSMMGLFQGKRISPKLYLNQLLTSFSENGPCLVNPDGKTTNINPFRWLDISLPVYYLFIFILWIAGTVSVIVRDPGALYAHATQDVNIIQVIYIDQPIGTGFSFGTDTVNSTASAAPPIWEAFQILFQSGQFSKFKSRKFV